MIRHLNSYLAAIILVFASAEKHTYKIQGNYCSQKTLIHCIKKFVHNTSLIIGKETRSSDIFFAEAADIITA